MKPIEELNDDLLTHRLHGLSMNLFFSGRRLFVPADIERAFYATLAEVKNRGAVPALKVETIIGPDDPAPVFHNKYVVRYSSFASLKRFVDGHISFTPAAQYAGLSNEAQCDDELRRCWHIADQSVEISGVPYMIRDGSLSHEMRKQDGKLATYHTLCMSVEESRKLQRAFGADGYVLVHDFSSFYEIITKGLANKYGTIAPSSGVVKYYDDLNEPTAKNLRDLAFTKRIAYKYQREARIAIFGVEPADRFLETKVVWPKGLISEIKCFE